MQRLLIRSIIRALDDTTKGTSEQRVLCCSVGGPGATQGVWEVRSGARTSVIAASAYLDSPV